MANSQFKISTNKNSFGANYPVYTVLNILYSLYIHTHTHKHTHTFYTIQMHHLKKKKSFICHANKTFKLHNTNRVFILFPVHSTRFGVTSYSTSEGVLYL